MTELPRGDQPPVVDEFKKQAKLVMPGQTVSLQRMDVGLSTVFTRPLDILSMGMDTNGANKVYVLREDGHLAKFHSGNDTSWYSTDQGVWQAKHGSLTQPEERTDGYSPEPYPWSTNALQMNPAQAEQAAPAQAEQAQPAPTQPAQAEQAQPAPAPPRTALVRERIVRWGRRPQPARARSSHRPVPRVEWHVQWQRQRAAAHGRQEKRGRSSCRWAGRVRRRLVRW
jgi:hypothetical protein